jgi:prevent-host-death family protein
MSTVINVHDLKTNYSRYLEQVIAGNEVLLGKHGKPVAKIVPLSESATEPRKLGMLKGKLRMNDNFNEPMMELWDTIADK